MVGAGLKWSRDVSLLKAAAPGDFLFSILMMEVYIQVWGYLSH